MSRLLTSIARLLLLALPLGPIGCDQASQVMDGAMDGARESARRDVETQTLKPIIQAVHRYHDEQKSFPPPAIHGADGEPLLSWRVAILPFLPTGASLHGQFHLDEPWDSPHNRKLVSQIPPIYARVGSASDGTTRLMVFTGEGTLSEGEEPCRMAQVRDGTSNTIFSVVAGPDKAVPWTKPQDLPLDPADPAVCLGRIEADYFTAGFCDGSVHQIPLNNDPAILCDLIDPNDGHPVGPDWFIKREKPIPKPGRSAAEQASHSPGKQPSTPPATPSRQPVSRPSGFGTESGLPETSTDTPRDDSAQRPRPSPAEGRPGTSSGQPVSSPSGSGTESGLPETSTDAPRDDSAQRSRPSPAEGRPRFRRGIRGRVPEPMETANEQRPPGFTPAMPAIPRGGSPHGIATLAGSNESPGKGQTELVGGRGGGPFRIVHPAGLPVIGVRWRPGKWAGRDLIGRLEPLYAKETARGWQTVMARDGYAVGAIQVDGGDFVNAVRIAFMRIEGDRLKTSDTYVSEWIGKPVPGAQLKTLAGQGAFILGIYGRQTIIVDAVGLVFDDS